MTVPTATAFTVVAYMFVSVLMVVANRYAVRSLDAGVLLVAAQLAATCLAAVVLHVVGIGRDFAIKGRSKDAALWAPAGLLFGLLVYIGMQAVKFATLSTLMVVRNFGPLFLLLAEWVLFGERPTLQMVASLLVVIVGICCYVLSTEGHGSAGNGFKIKGEAWVALDALLVCVGKLFTRFFLQDRPLELTTGALVFIGNSVGLLPVVWLILGPKSYESKSLDPSPWGFEWAAISIAGGICIAYLSIHISREVSATTALLVSNLDKVVVVAFGVLFLGEVMNPFQALGCLVALAGGVWHALVRVSSHETKKTVSERTPIAVHA